MIELIMKKNSLQLAPEICPDKTSNNVLWNLFALATLSMVFSGTFQPLYEMNMLKATEVHSVVDSESLVTIIFCLKGLESLQRRKSNSKWLQLLTISMPIGFEFRLHHMFTMNTHNLLNLRGTQTSQWPQP